ncbi:hypothetical protein [Actinoplanes sp. GCM10030250]|uniref:hypothetical protein n=1 Tax=Actinoplanes sp. GCM10030250 TaxID=3273376 RepID=UPI003612C0EA
MDEHLQRGASNEQAECEIAHRFLLYLAENGDSDVLRELGTEVRRGNISLSDGIAFSTYADALEPKVNEFHDWYQCLSEDERRKEAAACAAEVEKLEAKLAAEANAQDTAPGSPDKRSPAPSWRLNQRPE